ncbi:MAG: hypothetical protein ACREGD_04480 [Candidatus Saccharimonadales bacterium]
MSFWRKSGVVVVAALLPVVLFAWGLFFATHQMVAAPDRLKQTLETSGIYQTLVGDILRQTENSEAAPDGEKQATPTDQPEVQQAVKAAASPEFLKSQVERFLDDIYAWVRGDSERLEFQIDLTETKARLADGLASAVNSRLASLPECSGSVSAGSFVSFDPFTAECVPRGLDSGAATAQIRSEVDKLIEKPLITQDDIKNDQGQPLGQQLQALPVAYNGLVLGTRLGALAVVLLAGALILLSIPWRAGLKRVGIVFVVVGGATSLLALGGTFVFKRLSEGLGGGKGFDSAITLAHLFADGFRTWWLGYGLFLLLLGIAALVALNFIKQRREPAAAEKMESAEKTGGKLPDAKTTATSDIKTDEK